MYVISVLLGILLATVASGLIDNSSDPYLYCKCAFISGLATSIVGIYIKSTENITSDNPDITLRVDKNNNLVILKIAVLSVFRYLTYLLPFGIFVTIAKSFMSLPSVLILTILMLIIMLIISGYFIKEVNIKKFMIVAVAILSLISLSWVIFYTIFQLDRQYPWICYLIEILSIIVAIPFTVALNIWFANITDNLGNQKYLILGKGEILGVCIFIALIELIPYMLY
jgi:hypothetical protein